MKLIVVLQPEDVPTLYGPTKVKGAKINYRDLIIGTVSDAWWDPDSYSGDAELFAILEINDLSINAA